MRVKCRLPRRALGSKCVEFGRSARSECGTEWSAREVDSEPVGADGYGDQSAGVKVSG